MRIERLVIGSTNPAKVEEWEHFLERFNVKGIGDLGNFPEPREAGRTFTENAIIKATHYAKITGEFAFSEDGGYEVDALGGAPGVRSRRILPGDKDGTDQELIDYILEKLRGLPHEKRGVKLSFVAAVSDPEGKTIFLKGNSLAGIVAEKPGPVRIEGYPFRTIHLIPELGKTYAELTAEEHEKYNHKRPVAEKLVKFLIEYR
ncbi:non-canonical purine NTP pyrophosphatase [Patescibacteria group bacterium]|nr:non-canonical purine NTP pyrophosphatase [Patescibacteria group bacterium]